MSQYGPLERSIARFLDSFPVVKQLAKSAYQRTNYWVHGDADFQFEVHPGATMLTPDQWAGVTPLDGSVFFGYYDKSPWSPDMDRLLMHQLSNPGTGELMVWMFDRDRHTLQSLGTTEAWNVQQGSMAQWVSRNGDAPLVLYNAIEEETLGTRVIDPEEGEGRFVPWPVQSVRSGGEEILSLNYKRLYDIRPEYGYAAHVNNFQARQNEGADGLWRVDLASGEAVLVASLRALRRIEPRPEMDEAQHKVNHAMYSPKGERFVFMHRWVGTDGKYSRLYTARSDGSDLRLLLDDRMVSHYNWLDETYLLAWARTEAHGDHYYMINTESGTHELIGEGILDVFGDGHPSFSPDRRWIVTDTYPDKSRLRHLLLFSMHSEERIEVGRFHAPFSFDGPVRCDLHPRWSPDGRYISIDSAHEGQRRSYILDVRAVTEASATIGYS